MSVIHLVPKDGRGDTDEGISTWLRQLADHVEAGDLGKVEGACVIFNVMQEDDAFSCKMRRCSMTFLETVGALTIVIQDMLGVP